MKKLSVLGLSAVLLLAGCAVAPGIVPDPSAEIVPSRGASAPVAAPTEEATTAAATPSAEPAEPHPEPPVEQSAPPVHPAEALPQPVPSITTAPQPAPTSGTISEKLIEEDTTPSEPEPEAVPEPAVETSEPVAPPTEPAVGTPEPIAPPHAEYAPGFYADLVPVSTYDEVRVVRHAGTTWNIAGDGYAPGAEIHVLFGPARSDVMVAGGTAVADANGSYSFQIILAPDLEPGSYGIMTVPLTGLTPPEMEAVKRYASVDVVAA